MNPDLWSLDAIAFGLSALAVVSILSIMCWVHYLIFDRWRWTKPKGGST